MSGSASLSLDRGAAVAGHFPAEKLHGIVDLCRQLVSTGTLGGLLENIVRQSVDILRVRSSRILILEPDGSFTCQAVHSTDPLEQAFRRNRRHSLQAQMLYQAALLGQEPLIFGPANALPADLRLALRMGYTDSLYLVPLRASQEAQGLMALVEDSHASGDIAQADKLRLAALIADQAAGAIYRARRSYPLEESQIQSVQALARMMESRDTYIGGHSRKVTAVAVRLARAFGCDPAEIQSIRWAAMLHDIGKVRISEDILNKETNLDAREWQIIRRHPADGAEIVRLAANLHYVAALIQSHHENYDGSGYPYGLQHEMIPLGGRILAVSDAFAAMTDDRPYHKASTAAEAVAELIRCSGTQFDPHVVEAFTTRFP